MRLPRQGKPYAVLTHLAHLDVSTTLTLRSTRAVKSYSVILRRAYLFG